MSIELKKAGGSEATDVQGGGQIDALGKKFSRFPTRPQKMSELLPWSELFRKKEFQLRKCFHLFGQWASLWCIFIIDN